MGMVCLGYSRGNLVDAPSVAGADVRLRCWLRFHDYERLGYQAPRAFLYVGHRCKRCGHWTVLT